MKITRQNLKDLITEEIRSHSILLEQPADYRDEDSPKPEEMGEPIDLLAQQLHHLGRQADTLFQIVSAAEVGSNDRISEETRASIERLTKEFEEIFKAVEMDHTRPDRRY
jgi:hypothetical protein